MQVHVIGASGRSGRALCASLLSDGTGVVPVVRDAGRWAAARMDAAPRVADLRDAAALREALRDAAHVVSCAHARHAPAIIAAAPTDAVLILLGSTRKFTRWPDEHGNGVLAGEAAFLTSGRKGVMLHPTMIYGASGEDNVRRLAALLRRLPLVPLPEGGRALVQPIYQDDVTRAIRAALSRDWDSAESLVVAGPAAVPYAEFVRQVAAAAGVRCPRILSLPVAPLVAAAGVTRVLPFVPRVRGSEIRRLLEDKAFDIGPMRARLGIEPVPLHEGLARTFGQPHKS
jgi:uncharacterized protein YbjT (DUF2867 family)